ncbi:MAG: TonB-dependent receptor [Proteobacteria bacterium]|nr:TonB-dependent receptor [Pseudomonadota bacterium]
MRKLLGAALAAALLFAASSALAQEVEAEKGATPAEADENVDEVVVTGTRTVRLRREAPVRTDVIGETVLRLAAPKNLADALEYLPGARAESNCQNCNTTEIQLLGLPGAYNQILFDGLPLLSGVAGVYGVEQIPAILIERIEVVKGGASALYGPGAVAGVVNVIPRRIGDTGVRASLTHERPDGEPYYAASLAATYAFDDGGNGVAVFAHGEHASPVDYDGDGYSELAERDLAIVGGRARLALGPRSTLLLDYRYTAEDRRGGNRLDQPSFLANISEAIDTRLNIGSVSLEHELGPDMLVAATYALALTKRDTFYGGLGQVETDPSAPGFDPEALAAATALSRNQYGFTDDALHFAEVRGEVGLGSHSVIGGVQYRFESVDDQNVDVEGRLLGQLVDDSFDDLGVFVQDEWSLASNLRLVLGGRTDFSSELNDPVFSPRVGLWWSPSEPLVLRANVSTGFRAPEVFSEDLHIDTLGGVPIRVRSDPALVEESSVSASLGFDWRPTFREGAFTLDGQAYYTTLEDTLFLGEIQEEADGTLFRIRSNQGGSTITGAELTGTYRANERLRGSVGVSYVDARYDEPQIVFEDEATTLTVERYLKSPRLTAVGQLVFEPFERLQGFLALRYIDRMDVLNNRTGSIVRTPSFVVVDLSLTRHTPVGVDGDVDVTFGVKNLTDARQRDIEVGASRDSDYVYGPRSPRSLFVRLDAAF